jgi:hypothetical protein
MCYGTALLTTRAPPPAPRHPNPRCVANAAYVSGPAQHEALLAAGGIGLLCRTCGDPGLAISVASHAALLAAVVPPHARAGLPILLGPPHAEAAAAAVAAVREEGGRGRACCICMEGGGRSSVASVDTTRLSAHPPPPRRRSVDRRQPPPLLPRPWRRRPGASAASRSRACEVGPWEGRAEGAARKGRVRLPRMTSPYPTS